MGRYRAIFKEEEELLEIIGNYNDINSKLVGDKSGKPYKKSALNLFKCKFKRFVKKYNNIYDYKRCTYNLVKKAVKLDNTAIVEYLLKENISPVMIHNDIYDKMNKTLFPNISYVIDGMTSVKMKQLLAGSTLDKLDEYDKICNSIKDFNMENGRINFLEYDNKEQLKIELRQILELNFDMVENFEREENIELNYDLAEVFPDVNFKKEKETFCSIC